MKTFKINLFYSNACERAMNIRGYFFMKNFHKAVKEYKFYKSKTGFNPTILYNFLSDKYWVTSCYNKNFLRARFYKSHEIII